MQFASSEVDVSLHHLLQLLQLKLPNRSDCSAVFDPWWQLDLLVACQSSPSKQRYVPDQDTALAAILDECVLVAERVLASEVNGAEAAPTAAELNSIKATMAKHCPLPSSARSATSIVPLLLHAAPAASISRLIDVGPSAGDLELTVSIPSCTLKLLMADQGRESFPKEWLNAQGEVHTESRTIDEKIIADAFHAAIQRYALLLHQRATASVLRTKQQQREREQKAHEFEANPTRSLEVQPAIDPVDAAVDAQPVRVELANTFHRIEDREQPQAQQRSIMPEPFLYNLIPSLSYCPVDLAWAGSASFTCLIGDLQELCKRVRCKVRQSTTTFQPRDKGTGEGAAQWDLRDDKTFAWFSSSHAFLRWLVYQQHADERFVSAINGAVVERAVEYMCGKLIGVAQLGTVFRDLMPLFASNTIHSIPRGIVLHGPPGTGKTTVMRTLLDRTGMKAVGPPLAAADFAQGIVGDSERLVNLLADRARLVPWQVCYLMIDEIDALAPNRSSDSSSSGGAMASTLNAILSVITGIKDAPNLVLVGATNLLEQMDPAFNRRMHLQVFIGVLNATYRAEWIAHFRAVRDQHRKLALSQELEEVLVNCTINFSADAMMKLLTRLSTGVEVDRSLLLSRVRQVCVNDNIRFAGDYVCSKLYESSGGAEAEDFIKLGKATASSSSRGGQTGRLYVELPDTSDVAALKLQAKTDAFHRRIYVERSISTDAERSKLVLVQALLAELNTLQTEVNEEASGRRTSDRLGKLREVQGVLQRMGDNGSWLRPAEKLMAAWMFFLDDSSDKLLLEAVQYARQTKGMDWGAIHDTALQLQGGVLKKSLQAMEMKEALWKQPLLDVYAGCLKAKVFFASDMWGCKEAREYHKQLSLCLLASILLHLRNVQNSLESSIDFASGAEAFAHPSAFALSDGPCKTALLTTLLRFSSAAGLDVVVLLDIHFFLEKQLMDENRMLLCMSQTVRECSRYRSSLVILDMDSLAEITRVDSAVSAAQEEEREEEESKQALRFRSPPSYRILREALFQHACRLMSQHAAQTREAQHWVCALVKHPELIRRFEFNTMWPRTEEEMKRQGERSRLRAEQKENDEREQLQCSRCFAHYAERDNARQPPPCTPHHSHTFYCETEEQAVLYPRQSSSSSSKPVTLRRLSYADTLAAVQLAELDKAESGGYVFYPRFVKHSCCGQPWLSPGCTRMRTKHQPMPLPELKLQDQKGAQSASRGRI